MKRAPQNSTHPAGKRKRMGRLNSHIPMRFIANLSAVLHALFFVSIIARPFLLCNCYFPHRSPDRSACTAGVGRSCVSCRPDDGAAGRLERRSRPAPPAVSMIFSPSCAASPLSGQLPISKPYPVQGAAVGLDTDPPRDLNPTGGDASSNLTRLLRVGVAIAAPSAADTAVGMKRS